MSNLNTQVAGYAGITTQTDVTASRVADGTVYHNTLAVPLTVAISITATALQDIGVYSDATVNPSTQIGRAGAGAAGKFQVVFIVLPGNYYSAYSAATIFRWIEYS
jgi:hypothetical protein